MQWYEYPENFPALIVAENTMAAVVHYHKMVSTEFGERPVVVDIRDEIYYIDTGSNWRLATKEEAAKLHTKD